MAEESVHALPRDVPPKVQDENEEHGATEQ
jgi:hypothetical protein